MKTTAFRAAIALTSVLATACTNSTDGGPTGSTSRPSQSIAAPNSAPASVDPANFVRSVTNEWFPLRPGERREYRGEKDGKSAREIFAVTSETKTILGVTCTVVRDNLYLDGELEERTDDWYAQDEQGNVWYFGEDTAELDPDGTVASREGSWTAGEDGARAGIYITAQPHPGVDYQQEYYKGHAEDHFAATRTGVPVTVPFRSFADTLETAEYTPLEPGVIDHKYYAKGIGVVKEASEDGDERLELVAYTR